MKHVTAVGLALFMLHALIPSADAQSWHSLQHRGCCSHHHGVCGCEGGRAKCCDGELSPTCGCD